MTTQALAVRSAVDIITSSKDKFLASVPRDIDRERFFAVALSVLKDEKLAACTERSKLDSIYRFARLGFDPDPVMGEGYVIPRKCKRRVRINGQWQDQWDTVACFQPGYRGLTKLARKSRTIADIHAEVVYEGEPFAVHYGTNRRIEHEPCVSVDAEPGEIRAAYVTWLDLASRTVNFHVIDRKRIARARAVNKKEDRASPWDTDEAAMVRKTAIIDASKFWQLSAELAEAVEVDRCTEAGEIPPSVVPPDIHVEASPVEEENHETSELDEYNEPSDAAPVDQQGGSNAPAAAHEQPTSAASFDIEAEAAAALGRKEEERERQQARRNPHDDAKAWANETPEAMLIEAMSSGNSKRLSNAKVAAKVSGPIDEMAAAQLRAVAFHWKLSEPQQAVHA